MNNAFRVLQLFCILLLIGFAAGCGSEDPVVQPPVDQTSPGSIGVYGSADATSSRAVVQDDYLTVYVVHVVEDGATASNFRIEAPAGWTLESAVSPFEATIGDINEGISIAYGDCMRGPIHLMTLTYQALDDTQYSGTFRVLAHTQWPNGIQVANCNYDVLENGRGIDTEIQAVPAMESGGDQDRKQPKTDQ